MHNQDPQGATPPDQPDPGPHTRAITTARTLSAVSAVTGAITLIGSLEHSAQTTSAIVIFAASIGAAVLAAIRANGLYQVYDRHRRALQTQASLASADEWGARDWRMYNIVRTDMEALGWTPPNDNGKVTRLTWDRHRT